MKILRFKGKAIHSYMDFDISFEKTVTFLIGINGSGKTTVLKLILGLITPSYKYLANIGYDEIEIYCLSQENTRIRIKSKKINQDMREISLYRGNQKVSTDRFNCFDEISKHFEKKLDDKFADNFDLMETTREIRELHTPMFLGLDRRIFKSENHRNIIYNERTSRRFSHTSANDSLSISLLEAQETVNDYYRTIPKKQAEHSFNFKNSVLSKSFEYTKFDSISSFEPDLSQIGKKRKELNKAIELIADTNLQNEIEVFFNNIEALSKKIKLKENKDEFRLTLEWLINNSQLIRIDKIIELSTMYQKQISNLYDPIHTLEEIINNFLGESNKVLEISDNGFIRIILPNGTKTTINTLSSGEKQILIMITHLVFNHYNIQNKSSSCIFIIDEPEISLHLFWQEIFVDSLLKANPNAQYILATHSPTIIGNINNEVLCQDLSPQGK